RRKDRRARAYDHAGVSALDAMPLLGALAVGERGMKDRDFVPENFVQIGSDGRGEADLGNEENSGAPSFEDGAHSGEIDGGLARTGDTVKQHAGKSSC